MGLCVYVAQTGRIPGWVWQAQREEFERLFAAPSKPFTLSLVLSLVAVLFSILSVAVLSGRL